MSSEVKMNKFRTKLRGYDKKEVDEYLLAITSSYEERLKEQADRIDELKAECAVLKGENDAFCEREKSVSKALLAASEKAEEIEAAAKVRYSLEIQRLNSFRDKWTDYLAKISADKAISADVKRFTTFLEDLECELTAVMEHDLNMSVTAGAEKYSQYLKEKSAKKSEHGFDLKEALTPKQTLAEICKELGLTD